MSDTLEKTRYLMRLAALDDWTDIKSLWCRFQKSKATNYIHASLDDLGMYLVNGLVYPHQVALLVGEMDDSLISFCSICAVTNPQLSAPSLQPRYHGFIHSIYVESSLPSGDKVPRKAGMKFLEDIENWARERNCEYLFGNVRMDGSFNALYRKYGFEKTHLVISKKIGGK
jgi:hypothetical protein